MAYKTVLEKINEKKAVNKSSFWKKFLSTFLNKELLKADLFGLTLTVGIYIGSGIVLGTFTNLIIIGMLAALFVFASLITKIQYAVEN